MKTIMHDVGKFPEKYDYRYGELEPLGEWDQDRLSEQGIDEVWYWYANGGYEGSGDMLLRRGDQWDTHGLGHCSCYGPIEHLEFFGHTLEELKASLQKNTEAWRNVEGLFSAAETP